MVDFPTRRRRHQRKRLRRYRPDHRPEYPDHRPDVGSGVFQPIDGEHGDLDQWSVDRGDGWQTGWIFLRAGRSPDFGNRRLLQNADALYRLPEWHLRQVLRYANEQLPDRRIQL